MFRELSGEYDQQPPPISAKKVGGVKAYELARRHQQVELPSVRVHVKELTLLAWEPPRLRFRVLCSGGAYVRSLVHDLGRRLSCGAHVAELRRLASGEFTDREAVTLERLRQLRAEQQVAEALLPAESLLPEFPAYKLPAAAVATVLHGCDFRTFPAGYLAAHQGASSRRPPAGHRRARHRWLLPPLDRSVARNSPGIFGSWR